VLLFSAVVVCLMALMFLAVSGSTGTTAAYAEGRDAITAIVLTVIIVSVVRGGVTCTPAFARPFPTPPPSLPPLQVYILVLIVAEIVLLYQADRRNEALKKRSAATDASAGRKHVAGGGDKGGGTEDFHVGAVENQMNPMFLSSNGGAAVAESAVSAIMAQREAPPLELWRVFQSQFAEMHDQLDQMRGVVAAARKREVLGDGAGGGDPSGDGGDALDRVRTGRKQRQEFTPSRAGGGDEEEEAGMRGRGGSAVGTANPLRARTAAAVRLGASGTSIRALAAKRSSGRMGGAKAAGEE